MLWQVDTHQQVVERSIYLRYGMDLRVFSRINRSDVFPIYWMIQELIKGDDLHMMITSTFAAVASSITLILMMCAFCACVHRCEN